MVGIHRPELRLRALPAILLALLLCACSISESVVIEAPIDVVWSYVSASEHAAEWSVYFHHITPLAGMPDGQVGSIRRCFRTATETDGVWWDEVVLEVQPERYRRILAYNAHGFPDPLLNSGEFYVHQIFQQVGADRTRLTFAAEQLRPAGLLMRVRFFGPAREGRRTIRHNLDNIRAAVEARRAGLPVARVHPYLAPGEHLLDRPRR